jgi:hypothetical protein
MHYSISALPCTPEKKVKGFNDNTTYTQIGGWELQYRHVLLSADMINGNKCLKNMQMCCGNTFEECQIT